MLSSDKNVESLAQLIEALKDYLGLQKEYVKLDVIDKVVRLLKALTVAIIFVILGVAVFFYFSFAAIFWLATLTGTATAFLIISILFLLLLLLVILFRKSWIERPLVRFLTNTLLK